MQGALGAGQLRPPHSSPQVQSLWVPVNLSLGGVLGGCHPLRWLGADEGRGWGLGEQLGGPLSWSELSLPPAATWRDRVVLTMEVGRSPGISNCHTCQKLVCSPHRIFASRKLLQNIKYLWPQIFTRCLLFLHMSTPWKTEVSCPLHRMHIKIYFCSSSLCPRF